MPGEGGEGSPIAVVDRPKPKDPPKSPTPQVSAEKPPNKTKAIDDEAALASIRLRLADLADPNRSQPHNQQEQVLTDKDRSKEGFDEVQYKEAINFFEGIGDYEFQREPSSIPHEVQQQNAVKLKEHLSILRQSLSTGHFEETIKYTLSYSDVLGKKYGINEIATEFLKDDVITYLADGNLQKITSMVAGEVKKDPIISPHVNYFQELLNHLQITNPTLYEQIHIQMHDMVNKFGLDTVKTLAIWNASATKDNPRTLLNLATMQAIESVHSDAVKYLNENYNIYNFGFYPPDILIKQYENRDRNDIPYGVSIYPQYDHNDTLYAERNLLDSMDMQLESNGYMLRIYEAGDVPTLIHDLNHARKKHGKIDFALINGHANRNLIRFGKKTPGVATDLTIQHLLAKGAQATSLAFTEKPTIIVTGCSSGEKGGVAEQISNIGANVIAPDRPGGLYKVTINKDEQGKLHFQAEYMDSKTGIPVNTILYGA